MTVGCTQSASNPVVIDIGPIYVPADTGAATVDGISYEYIATADREAQILAGFQKLKVGQSREEVRDVMGPPDMAFLGRAKGPDPDVRFWVFVYKIKQMESEPMNVYNDTFIRILFDTDGKLNVATPYQIAGLKSIKR